MNPQTSTTYLNVKLSRIFLFLIFCIGLLFFLVGLDLTFFHQVFNIVNKDKQILLWIFDAFAIVGGLAIMITQAQYIISPASVLKITEEGISFGTGLRYKPQFIPWEYVESCNFGHGYTNMSANPFKDIIIGVSIHLKNSTKIPSSAITSAGISYINYSLFVNGLYIDTGAYKIIEVINKKIKESNN